jgi:hypothetical protein
MKIAICRLVGTSPYSQSKHYDESVSPKKNGELPSDYENRTWKSRTHTTKDGHVFIPAMSFANAIKTSCKRMRLKVKGKGNSEYTKHFEAGVMVLEDLKLSVKTEAVEKDTLFVPSDGVRGSGKRVTKHFPRVDEWKGDVKFYILDDVITEEVFVEVLKNAGLLVGIGRFRPEKCGFYGRFEVRSVEWQEMAGAGFSAEEAAE